MYAISMRFFHNFRAYSFKLKLGDVMEIFIRKRTGVLFALALKRGYTIPIKKGTMEFKRDRDRN